ncbi:MAG: putative bifunctional diguanylate cyclase/phosphodiesterase [Almyronema sp.]
MTSLLTTTLLSATKQVGLLQDLELFAFDQLTQLQPKAAPDDRILIVGITESDIQQYGWPLSDQLVAKLLQKLQQHQPQVVGLDLYRSTQRSPGRADLLRQLAASNLVAIMNVGSDTESAGSETEGVPPPAIVPWQRIGFNDLVLDPDGVVRRSLLYVSAPEHPYYAFGLRVAMQYSTPQLALQADGTTLRLAGVKIPALVSGSGGYQTVDARGYQILLHYRSATSPAREVSVEQVLSDRLNPEWVRNKVVLIGSTAPSLKDQFWTPYSAQRNPQLMLSGVVIHAQITSHLLDVLSGEAALYRFLPAWGEVLWLWSWTLLAGIVSWQTKRSWLAGLGMASLLMGIWSLGWLGLWHQVWLPVAEPLLGAIAAGSLVIVQKMIYRSTYDKLTQLPGREIFNHQVQQALQIRRASSPKTPIIVAFLGVNRFKFINQSLGHAVGDQVLLAIVQRLRQVLPASTPLARIGGDEFAILFQHSSQKAVEKVLSQLQQGLSEPFCIEQQYLSLSASVGLAVTQTYGHQKSEDLLRDAHTAMYRAKALKTFQCQVFATGMLTEAVNRLRLEGDLQQALAAGEFLLYYQPIVCLRTGQITGFEALVRWQQTARGFVLPGDFIPVAEETGLIVPLGEWIFQAACYQLRGWQQQFPELSLKISVNLSRRQLRQPNLAEQIRANLQAAGMTGQQVRLEITESMVMEDAEAAIVLMQKLKTLGLQLSIDDFGTGHSSLSYLHRFPVDTLKIDKSFVEQIEQSHQKREIVHTIVALGHKLGMEIVAEGIETERQRSVLDRAHCQYGQGYLFSPPLSGEAATRLLARQSRLCIPNTENLQC